MSDQSTEEMMNVAMSAWAREYRGEINALADSLRKRIDAAEFDSTDEILEAVDEALDGHQYVIYTKYNYWVLMESRNDAEMASDLGIECRSADYFSQTLAGMTYFAMRADLMEELGDLQELLDSADPQDEDAEEQEEVDA